MLLLTSVIIFLLILGYMYYYQIKVGIDFIPLEQGIASEVADREVELNSIIKLKKNIVIHNGLNKYLLGPNGYTPIVAAGDSMKNAGVLKGDLVLFENSVDINNLKIDDLVAIRMSLTADRNAGKIKFRLFSKVSTDGNGDKILFLNKFSKETGEVVPSSGTHKLDSILGVKSVVFNKDFTKKFLAQNTLH